MHNRDLIEGAQAIFLDWDGCVFEGGSFKPGAVDFMRAYRERISIVSNASAFTAHQLARAMARVGAPIPAERIFLAGEVALALAAERWRKRPVLVVGAGPMRRLAQRRGVTLAGRDAQAVVLLRDPGFTYAKLMAAANIVRAGAPLIVANPDLTHPAGGGVMPETGALLAALAACTDLDAADVTVVGKPSRFLFERALAQAGCRPDHALMIGDNPRTDIEGARRLGLRGMLLDAAANISLETLLRPPARRTSAAA